MKIDSAIASEALAEALGEIIGEMQRQWQQELEILRAERRALIAEIRLSALGQPPADGAETAKPTAKQARAR